MLIRKTDGFALIDLIFVCGIIGVLCATALPRLLMARQAATATSAIANLRTINSAELSFALTCGGGFYATTLPTLGTAPAGAGIDTAFISPDLAGAVSVIKSGYLVQLDGIPYAGSPLPCNGGRSGDSSRGYAAAADPSEPNNFRFFATNADGVIYEDSASMFAAMPELGAPVSGAVLNHW
jgi:type II secretory pathway pseudopilin PulG